MLIDEYRIALDATGYIHIRQFPELTKMRNPTFPGSSVLNRVGPRHESDYYLLIVQNSNGPPRRGPESWT